MTDTQEPDTDHQQPRRRSARRGTPVAASSESAIEATAGTVDTATEAAATEAAATADPVTDTAASSAAQRAGAAAQRAGVAAQRATGVLSDVATDVAATVSAHAPAVVDASRTTAGYAVREVRSASSENLMLGSVFSSGVAFGLMLARAPRILVLLGLAPAVVFGANLIGRRMGRGSSAARKPGTKSNSLS